MRYDVIFNTNDARHLYNNGYSLRYISRLLRIPRKNIRQLITKSSLIRTAGNQMFLNAFINNKKARWFDKVDSHLKAYWLGFIYADGSLASNKRYIEISLSINDIHHLEKFAKIFGVNVTHDSYRCRCWVCNVYLCYRLISLGVLPNKTYIDSIEIFSNIPQEFINSFILGFMDGDGSVFTGKKHKNYIRMEFCGKEGDLLYIRDLFVNYLYVNSNKVRPSKSVFSVAWSGNQAFKVLDWLYKDSPIKLDRKYEVYKQVKIERGLT